MESNSCGRKLTVLKERISAAGSLRLGTESYAGRPPQLAAQDSVNSCCVLNTYRDRSGIRVMATPLDFVL